MRHYVDLNTTKSSESSARECVEYDLMDFLLVAAGDEITATEAVLEKIPTVSPSASRLNLSVDKSRSTSPDSSSDEKDDFAGDALDVVLSASSYVAGWINKPLNGCQHGQYGRMMTPDENKLDLDNCYHHQDTIEGVLSWDIITDKILLGLGFRADQTNEELKERVMIGLQSPLGSDASKSGTDEDTMKEAKQTFTFTDTDESKRHGNLKCMVQHAPSHETKVVTPAETNPKLRAYDQQDVSADVRDDSDSPRGDNSIISSMGNSVRSAGSKNDIVKQLVAKCLKTNNTSKKSAQVVSEPKHTPSLRYDNDAAAIISPEGNSGSKNDVVMKLVAKCLARNKKSSRMLPLDQGQAVIEPDGYLKDHNYTPTNFATAQSALETRNPPPSSDEFVGIPLGPSDYWDERQVLRPRPMNMEWNTHQTYIPSEHFTELSETRYSRFGAETYEQQPLTYHQPMHVKWSGNSNLIAAQGSLQTPSTEAPNSRSEENTYMSIGMAPNYYSQPPRPEFPLHPNEDITRSMKSFAKRASSSFRQVSEGHNAHELTSVYSKENEISVSAALRRMHYKEMLMQQRAAPNIASE